MPVTTLRPNLVRVGRVEPAAVPAVAEFAGSLRDLRQVAGQPSLSQLAMLAGCSASTAREALAGRRLPSRSTALALVVVLGGDPELWGVRWDALDTVVQEGREPPVTRRGPDGAAVCQVDGCPNVARGRWCSTHRRHFHLYGDPTAGRFSSKTHPDTCSVEGCCQPYWSLGFCRPHYRRHKAAQAAAAAESNPTWSETCRAYAT